MNVRSKITSLHSGAALANDCFTAIDSDSRTLISRASFKLSGILTKKCAGGSGGFLATAFPGSCVADTGSTATLAPCVEQVLRCRACRLLNEADGLDVDCDLFDDGVEQDSCEDTPGSTTTTTSTTQTTTTSSTTTTTVNLCSPPPDCSIVDTECALGVCNPANGACTLSPLVAGTACAAGAPAATITNVVVTDLSSADTKLDGGFDVNEWTHTLDVDVDVTTTDIDTHMAAVIGADACCTTGDVDLNRTVSYTVAFDVVSALSCQLTLDHSVLGAFSLLDERVANEDAGGTASITGVTAAVSVGGGPATDLSFSPSPGSRTHGLYGGEGDSDVEFSGSDSAVLVGSGNASVVFSVSFNIRAFSNSNLVFPAAGGDEIAVRMGLSDSITNGFTAGEYPNSGGALGSRNAALDGHFLLVNVIGTP
ncbi:MAG: hypothetical protein ACI8TX_002248 [Hyphomicrobiaceae bacterium]